jgi:hypothetical protein
MYHPLSIKKPAVIDEVVLLIEIGSSELQAKCLIFSDKLEIVIGFTQTQNWKTSKFR